MKIKLQFTKIILFVLFTVSFLHGEDTRIRWLGGEGNWNNSSKWNIGRVPGINDKVMIDISGSIVHLDSESILIDLDQDDAINSDIPNNSEVNIGAHAKLIIEMNGRLETTHLAIKKEGNLTIYGSVFFPQTLNTIENRTSLRNRGKIENYGVLRLPTLFVNSEKAEIINYHSTYVNANPYTLFTNNAIIINKKNFQLISVAKFENRGVIENSENGNFSLEASKITNMNSIINRSIIYLNNSTISNNLGSTFISNKEIELRENSTLENFGEFNMEDVNSYLFVRENSRLSNEGKFITNGKIDCYGKLFNSRGNIKNTGFITNYGQISNESMIDNPGVIVNYCGAQFENLGQITGNAPINNCIVVDSENDNHDANLSDNICRDSLGKCTLRAAIEQCNYNRSAASINFNILGEGPHIIKLTSELPPINFQIELNGFTQPGSRYPTEISIPQYMIILDGSLIQKNNVVGLNLLGSSDNSKLCGLQIQNFGTTELVGNAIQIHSNHVLIHGCYMPNISSADILITGSGNIIGGDQARYRNIIPGSGNGINIFPDANNNQIIGNYIGTDAEGELIEEELGDGISIAGNGNLIEFNLISGKSQGILISANDDLHIPNNNIIRNNKIGTNYNMSDFLPNEQGLSINHGDNNIIEKNVIAGNKYFGIQIGEIGNEEWTHDYSRGNRIYSNSIYKNGNMGIDLGFDWVTHNDLGDEDDGPNNLQNYPQLDSATMNFDQLTIRGRLQTKPNENYRIDFYLNHETDNSGSGEGEYFLGYTHISSNQDGDAEVIASVRSNFSEGHFITACATDSYGNSSEFSNPVCIRGSTPKYPRYTYAIEFLFYHMTVPVSQITDVFNCTYPELLIQPSTILY